MCKKRKGLKLLVKLVKLIKKSTKKLAGRSLTEEQECMVILFSDIVHLTDNCIAIFNAGDVISGVPILIRSLFERCVDLFILCKNINHYTNIKLYAHIQSKKFLNELKEAKQRDDDFNTGIPDIDQLIGEHLKKIAEYKGLGFKELNFVEKLEILENEYQNEFKRIYIYYRQLSGLSHNNHHQMILKYKNADTVDSKSTIIIEPKFKEIEYLIYLNYIAKIILYSFNDLMVSIGEDKMVTAEFVKISDQIKALQTAQ